MLNHIAVMKKNYITIANQIPLIFKASNSIVAVFSMLLLLVYFHPVLGQDFNKSNLKGAEVENSTSLKFGPDGRLYVSQQDGLLKAFVVQRNGANDYEAVKAEEITIIKNMPNHNDDGTLNTTLGARQVTGILVKGTPEQPILYVSSSDSRIGGPSKGDTNQDTNSGTVSRLTWIHDQPPLQTDFSSLNNEDLWEKVDLVRGLPRSEENHATNGMEIATIGETKYMFLSVGGLTNAGAPSQNFVKITEYALAAAVLSIDLTALEAMPVYTDARTGDKFIYDLPTLDDPDRENIDNTHADFPYPSNHPMYNETIDLGDPFGGNDGLNQAKVVVDGPVKVYAPGFRNTYDLVITQNRRMYVTDNGANPDWGGYPENEGTSNVTNNYWSTNEPGTNEANPFVGEDGEEWVNNEDHLELVTGAGTIDDYVAGSFYGGHPNPIRANPEGAGLYTHYGANGSSDGAFRTSKDDPEFPLPADWPPVPLDLANPVEGDFQNPGVDDNAVTIWPKNCNAIDEYTASNLEGKYTGNLIAGSSFKQGRLFRLELNPDGSEKALDIEFANVAKSFVLGITCQGDDDIFGGTVWLTTYDKKEGGIKILEPADYDGNSVPNCTGADDPNLDEDFDGFDNADEIDAGSDPCNGLDTPDDADQDFISDLNDPDDDNDGIEDHLDVFQLGGVEEVAAIPFDYELFNDKTGFYGLGLIGIMTNLDPNDNYINWLDVPNVENPEEDDVYGGATGVITVKMTEGDALGATNTQEKAFQMGVHVDGSTFPFTIRSAMLKPFHNFTGDESQGAFIGTGDQDNYIKIVLNAGGIAVVKEDAGTPETLVQEALSGGTSDGNITVFFSINPLNNTIQPRYAIDYNEEEGASNNIIDLGDPIPFTGKLLDVIQQEGNPLAVGIIGTSKGSAAPFKGSWDKFAAEFDPVTEEGEWFAIDGTVPTPRHENAFVQVGDHFYILGGRGDKKIEKYNLTTKTWSATNTSLNNIHHFQAVVYDGLIYIINGMTGGFPDETPLPNVLIYDPVNDKLITGPEIPEDRRRGSSGVVVYNDKIYVIAGIQNGHIDGWVKWADEFDPVTGEWKTLTDAPRERDHFMVAEKNGKIYVAGGRKSFYDGKNFDFSQTIAEVDVYDIETDQWTTLPNNIPTQRAGAPVGILGGELFVMGGEGTQKDAHPQTEALDLQTFFWRQAKDMLSPRHATQAIVNNGGIFVAAGSSKQGAKDMDSHEAFFLFGQKDPAGEPVPNSTLEPSAENIDFGTVEVGQSVTEDFSVTNGGSGLGIYIESISITGDPAFTLNGVPTTFPLNLRPGAKLDLSVALEQANEEGKNASISIQYSTSGTPLTIPVVVGSGGEPEPTGPIALINVGGGTYTDSEGKDWSADKNFEGGKKFEDTALPIDGTEDDKLYQSERYTNNKENQFAYEIPVEAGIYDISLHFAEIFFKESTDVGKRVFNVDIENGQRSLPNYDIIADVGPATAVVKTFTGITVEDGNLSIVLTKIQDNAKISAIEVYPNTGGEGLSIEQIADQNSKVGDEPQLTVIANGGVGNLTFSATNLPDGLEIEPTNGMIIGTVAGSALAGGSFNVNVSVEDEQDNTASIQFVWTVTSTVAGDADEDGVNDAADAFAFDPDNGTTTTLPVNIDFSNSSSVFANGFNGMMLDPAGEADFTTMHTPADVIVNGENGQLIINNIPGGDAFKAINTQKNAFQFGMQVPDTNFIVHTRILEPFIEVEPVKFRSMGMYVGNGDQDNYIKIVIGATPDKDVQIQVLKEVGGEVGDSDEQKEVNAAFKAAQFVDLFLEVDPINKTATPSYSVDGVPVESTFAPISIPEAWIEEVVALGIISTSTGGSVDNSNPFSTRWDVFDVKTPMGVVVTKTDAECAGKFGTASVEVSGGIAPHTVDWGEGVDPENLTGGTYLVEISDASGYKIIEEVVIDQPAEIVLSFTQTMAPTCTTNGEVTWEVSGTTDYTEEWTDEQGDPLEMSKPMSLPAGTYYLKVTDNASGCSTNPSVVLSPIDTVAPTLVGIPAEALITACGNDIPAAPEVTATDDCDADVAVELAEVVKAGKTIRTWTATDAAGNTTSFSQVIECPTGVEDELENDKLIVYPNPSVDKIVNFEVNLNSGATLQVYDMIGSLIIEKNVPSAATYDFNFSGYQSGSYLVKVFNEDEVIIKRFILH